MACRNSCRESSQCSLYSASHTVDRRARLVQLPQRYPAIAETDFPPRTRKIVRFGWRLISIDPTWCFWRLARGCNSYNIRTVSDTTTVCLVLAYFALFPVFRASSGPLAPIDADLSTISDLLCIAARDITILLPFAICLVDTLHCATP